VSIGPVDRNRPRPLGKFSEAAKGEFRRLAKADIEHARLERLLKMKPATWRVN
jgi:hypothetical protein